MKWKGELTDHQLRIYRMFKRDPDAWAKRVLEARPPKNRTDQQKHYRNVTIFHIYWSTNATLRELAKEHGLGVETVRTIAYQYLNMVYKLNETSCCKPQHTPSLTTGTLLARSRNRSAKSVERIAKEKQYLSCLVL